MNKIPTTKIVLDTHKKLNGQQPVKLRIIYDRKSKFYPCNYDLLKEEFDALYGLKLSRAQQKIKNSLDGIQQKAIEIISLQKHFSFEVFEDKFYERKSKHGNVSDLFDEMFESLRKNNQIGTCNNYKDAIASFKKFKSPLTFDDITPDFLQEFENWHRSKGNSFSTIGIYMRALRRVYNLAISKGIISSELYPFKGENKYLIPIGAGLKKAMNKQELINMFNYVTEPQSWDHKALDMWKFIYLTNGINIADVARLKYKNIYEDEIIFERKKTLITKRDKTKTITAALLPEAKEIIKTWGNKIAEPNNYIFPILSPGVSAEDEIKLVNQFRKVMNKHTKKIAFALGIDKNVTTYVARHSFATMMKRAGVSNEFIRDALGHSDLKTTDHYLDSFEAGTRRKNAEVLTAFENVV